ncbi:MAG: prepilin peptidase [Candidatus Aminicenantes bacterium]|nr:prepilin peptidase [Candidatus Aminicenantes bacterium]
MEEIILILLGLIFGSFLNVVIYRLPQGKSVIKPRSFCPSCNKLIKFYDNIPVVSYFLLGGKCRHCKAEIPLRYPLIEAFTAFSFWLAYFYFGHDPLYTAFTILFVFLLIPLAIIDLTHMILPDELTLGGAVIFLGYSFFHPHITVANAFIAGFGSALIFAGLYFFYLKVRKIEGLGFGDVKMMLFLGAFLGLHNLLVAILLASFSGLLVGLFFIIFKGKNLQLKLPFGTFLALGSYVSVFYGMAIYRLVRSLFI